MTAAVASRHGDEPCRLRRRPLRAGAGNRQDARIMSQRYASYREFDPLCRYPLYSLRGDSTMPRDILPRRLPW